jgi:hypothetical protein
MNLKSFLISVCVSAIVYTSTSLASQPTITCVGTCTIFDYDAQTILQQIPITSDSLDGLNQLCVVDAGEDIHPWSVRDTSCK